MNVGLFLLLFLPFLVKALTHCSRRAPSVSLASRWPALNITLDCRSVCVPHQALRRNIRCCVTVNVKVQERLAFLFKLSHSRHTSPFSTLHRWIWWKQAPASLLIEFEPEPVLLKAFNVYKSCLIAYHWIKEYLVTGVYVRLFTFYSVNLLITHLFSYFKWN